MQKIIARFCRYAGIQWKYIPVLLLLVFSSCHGQEKTDGIRFVDDHDIKVGARQTSLYFGSLEGKNMGVTCNHASLIGNVPLVDSLLSAGFRISRIYTPEHGFKGNVSEGILIPDGQYKDSDIPIVSLYGKNRKPSASDLEGVEVMIFDIQDVGARFYTYISTLTYIMEACADKGIPVIVLDRPNPNSFYVDGPVLDTAFRSFVGMHPVPVVYGMTIGEYALMVNGEGWLKDGIKCDLEVIPIDSYEHSMVYKIPTPPSPNLPNWEAVYLYPSLCLFEGTIVSVGRGTDRPFQVIGHPDFMIGSYAFKPESDNSKKPLYAGITCYGQSLDGYAEGLFSQKHHFTLKFLIGYYQILSTHHTFFNSYFDFLAGNDLLKQQIIDGLSEDEIRDSWQSGLQSFKNIRSKYLIYPDFQ